MSGRMFGSLQADIIITKQGLEDGEFSSAFDICIDQSVEHHEGYCGLQLFCFCPPKVVFSMTACHGLSFCFL